MGSHQWHVPWWRRHQHKRDRVRPEEDLGETKLNPVLLIPGIGGSILNAVTNSNGAKERIWVRLFLADREFRAKLWSKFNPTTGRTESLDPNSHIEVPDDNFGLYSCDILDPDIAVSLDVVGYFHAMILEMHKWGYVDGRDLFGFGYDFRQSNMLPETMARLLSKIKGIYEQSGKKVDVVTHSMGGLLFKSFVALHYDDVAKYVNKWVAVAAPFRGAPGFITDTLLTGVEFIKGWESSLFITKWSMHQLLVECPSIYELMADYTYPWDTNPELRIVRKTGPSGASVAEDTFSDISSVFSVMEKVLQGNTITVNGETIPLPLNKDIVALAEETRRLWTTARLPENVEFFSIYGVALDTPFHSQYGTEAAPLSDLSDILHTDAVFDCRDGDGTVPVESALGDGFPALYRVGVPGEHRALLNDSRVHRILHFFLKVPPYDDLYDPYSDCVLFPSRAEIEAEMEAMRLSSPRKISGTPPGVALIRPGSTIEELGPGKEGLGSGKQGLGSGKPGLGPGKEGLGRGKEGLDPGKEGLSPVKEGLGSGKPTLVEEGEVGSSGPAKHEREVQVWGAAGGGGIQAGACVVSRECTGSSDGQDIDVVEISLSTMPETHSSVAALHLNKRFISH